MIHIILNNSPKYGGGVEQVVANLVSNFSDENKSNIKILCNDQDQPEEFVFSGVQCLNLKGRRQFSALNKIFLGSQLRYSYRIYKYLRNNLAPGDKANIHGIEYAFATSLFRKRLPSESQIIVTAHGCYFDQFSNYLAKRLANRPARVFFGIWKYYIWVVEKIATRGIDRFIFISKFSMNFCRKVYRLNRKPLQVIYNGAYLDKREYKQPRSESALSAMVVGSSPDLKGLDIAVESVKQYNLSHKHKIKLNVIGFSSPVAGSESDPNINYIGRVAPSQMAVWYNKSDLLLMPSRSEAFPLTILEALQHGLPVIASIACHFDEVSNYEKIGIVVGDYDIQSWLHALDVIASAKKYNNQITEIKNTNLEKFDWRQLAAEYQKVFFG